jgi:hypothetical protein
VVTFSGVVATIKKSHKSYVAPLCLALAAGGGPPAWLRNGPGHGLPSLPSVDLTVPGDLVHPGPFSGPTALPSGKPSKPVPLLPNQMRCGLTRTSGAQKPITRDTSSAKAQCSTRRTPQSRPTRSQVSRRGRRAGVPGARLARGHRLGAWGGRRAGSRADGPVPSLGRALI